MHLEALLPAFEACSLPKSEWTHQAHLTVALWYVRSHGTDRATELLRANIPRYNNAIGGAPDGYHETITLAWVAVIAGFLADRDQGQPFAVLREALVRECGDKDYLLRFYTKDRLLSVAARRGWVEPDVATLPGRSPSLRAETT